MLGGLRTDNVRSSVAFTLCSCCTTNALAIGTCDLVNEGCGKMVEVVNEVGG